MENKIRENKFYLKYLKYKQKYLDLKQLGGQVDNSLFHHIEIATLPDNHINALINKFNCETEIGKLLENFYKYQEFFIGVLGKNHNETVSYNESLNFTKILESDIIINTNDFKNYTEFIQYLFGLMNLYEPSFDLIKEIQLKINKIHIDTNSIKNSGAGMIGIYLNKTLVSLKMNLITLIKITDINKLIIEYNKFKKIVKTIINIDPLETLKEIITKYTNNYDILKTSVIPGLTIPLVKPNKLSIECIYNKLAKPKADTKKRYRMFEAMGQRTLSYYTNDVLNKELFPSMKRYIVTYNDIIYMIVNTGYPIKSTKISEHIFIAKTPSLFISNMYQNIDEPNIAVKLHLYCLKTFLPKFFYSHPLSKMTDIFNTNFVKTGLFVEQPNTDIFGIHSKNLGFGMSPEVKYDVNHQVLNQMLIEYNLSN